MKSDYVTDYLQSTTYSFILFNLKLQILLSFSEIKDFIFSSAYEIGASPITAKKVYIAIRKELNYRLKYPQTESICYPKDLKNMIKKDELYQLKCKAYQYENLRKKNLLERLIRLDTQTEFDLSQWKK
jgi:hypothetical protein